MPYFMLCEIVIKFSYFNLLLKKKMVLMTIQRIICNNRESRGLLIELSGNTSATKFMLTILRALYIFHSHSLVVYAN